MICPSCATEADLTPQQGDLAICPGCCHTLVLNGESVRLAVKEDALEMTAQDRLALSRVRRSAMQARGLKVREKRR